MRREISFSSDAVGGDSRVPGSHRWAGRWLALVLCSIGLSSVATSATASCTEDVVPNSPGSTTHFVYKGYCSTKEEALAQCGALATAHGYPASYCSIGGTANPNAVGAAGGGWFKEQKDGKVTPFHLSIVDYGGAESLPPRLGMGAPTCQEHCAGDPINTLNGNKFETSSVVDGAGNGLLGLELTYNSLQDSAYVGEPAGVFGKNRSYSFGGAIVSPLAWLGEAVYATRPDGKALKFKNVQGAWVADPGRRERLNRTDDGWQLTLQDGSTEAYRIDGKLIRKADVAGRAVSLLYSASGLLEAVVDDQGRALTFTYNQQKLVEKVVTSAGDAIQFEYAGGLLSAVVRADGNRFSYKYKEVGYANQAAGAGALTGVIDELGNRLSSTWYDSKGKAYKTDLATGVSTFQVFYTRENDKLVSTTTSPGGATRRAVARTIDGALESSSFVDTCDGCIPRSSTYTFSQGLLSSKAVSGVVTKFERELVSSAPGGGLADVWVERKTEASDPPDSRTTEVWTRRDTNQVVKRVSPTRAVTWLRNARGQVTEERVESPTGEGRTTTYRYCDEINAQAGCPVLGLLLAVDGPMPGSADTVTYSYYPEDAAGCASGSSSCLYRRGDLWQVTNPAGHTVEYLSYDGAGRVTSQRDATGLLTSFEYHPRGWLTATRMHGGNGAPDRVTRIDYWPTGLTKQVTQPDGSYVSYRYDAAQRLVGIADAAENSVEYVLDNAGNTIAENTRDAAGTLTRALSRIYNARGELVTQADASSNPTDFAYDGNGNSTSVADALGRVTAHEYDPLNRLKRSVQDVGGIGAESQFKYDALDNLVEVTDPKGLKTSYVRNAFGEVVTQNSPDTGQTSFTYDSAGNVATRTDARGVTARYAYDALGRTTGVTFGDPTADIQYIYDQPSTFCAEGERAGAGRLASMIDSSGRTDYCYSAMGDLVRRVQTVEGRALTLRYAYDAFGRLQSMTYPDGSLVDYGYDALGQVGSVGVTPAGGAREVLLQGAQSLPFGPQKSWTFGNGRRLDRSYDLDYRPQTISDGRDGLNVAFGFDPVGNITSLTDHQEQEQSATLNYDALGRLTAFRDAQTGIAVEQYSYDATGNRLSFSNSAGVQPYVYPADSHRLASVDGVARTYDAMGNTLSIGGEWQYAYDLAGRLGSATRAGSAQASYRHNAAGQRVLQHSGAEKTLHLYGEGGEWLGAYNVSGAPTQQVVWLDSRPVGVIQAGKLLYVESDHLDSPRALIDAQRDVAVWRWSLLGEAFGASPEADDLDQNGDSQEFALRFAGQRVETSSGLSYNYHRDYEPRTGRFAQSDPIGLVGGISTYGYVGANPIVAIDRFGLQAYVPGTPPPPNIPGGPWTPSPGQPPGTFLGPKNGANRVSCRYVPDARNGGPPPATNGAYWKSKTPTSEWQRYDLRGRPITPSQAHPGNSIGKASGGGFSPLLLRPLSVFSVAFFFATYSMPLNFSEDESLGVMREEEEYCGRCGAD